MDNEKYMKIKLKIYDIKEIRKQYKAGFSINFLSKYWKIPYATLYRILKNKSRNNNYKIKIKK